VAFTSLKKVSSLQTSAEILSLFLLHCSRRCKTVFAQNYPW